MGSVNSYLCISRALDQFDLAYGSLDQAFAPVQAESLVVGFASDWLFLGHGGMERASATLQLRTGGSGAILNIFCAGQINVIVASVGGGE